MANNNISIFQKVEKYSGELSDDLTSWLRGFERCCVIAGKTEDLVKGQLLLLCLTGRALAVAEGLEEQEGAQQTFTQITTKLKAVFESEADKELKQEEFNKRHMKIEETEEEFMGDLVRLYRAANPNSSDQEKCRNVKRRFLSGIPATLKRNVFVFCNNPHGDTVTVDNLLEAVRKAKLYISEQQSGTESVNAIQSKTQESESSVILKAIDGLRQSLDSHIQLTAQRFDDQGSQINAITDNRMRHYDGNQRQTTNGRSGPPAAHQGGPQWGGGRNGPRNEADNQGDIGCYKCGELNHVARDCRKRSLNRRGRLPRR